MGRPGRQHLPKCSGGGRTLHLLLLLLLPRWEASARHAGETCGRWRQGRPGPVETFVCPQESDGEDARLCCGTCASAFCCSSVEARQDPGSCALPGPEGQLVAPTLQCTPQASPETSAQFFMLGLVVMLTLFLFIACFLLVNYESLQRCVGYCVEEQDTTPVMAAVSHPVSSLEEPLGPDPLDLHLPYSSCEMLLPPSSEEDPQRD